VFMHFQSIRQIPISIRLIIADHKDYMLGDQKMNLIIKIKRRKKATDLIKIRLFFFLFSN
jgi:hypothetical protein